MSDLFGWLRRKVYGPGLLEGLAVGVLAVRLFYDSAAFLPAALPVALFLMNSRKKSHERKVTAGRRKEYLEGLEAFAAALRAGYAAENALLQAASECRRLYGEKAWITGEYAKMASGVRLSRTAAEMFHRMSEDCSFSEARLFADVLQTAERSGGNLAGIADETCRILKDHLHLQEEIQAQLQEGELEQSVMSVIPLGMLLYLTVTSPGYFDVMYETFAGRLIMTAFLLLYGAACLLSEHILAAEDV